MNDPSEYHVRNKAIFLVVLYCSCSDCTINNVGRCYHDNPNICCNWIMTTMTNILGILAQSAFCSPGSRVDEIQTLIRILIALNLLTSCSQINHRTQWPLLCHVAMSLNSLSSSHQRTNVQNKVQREICLFCLFLVDSSLAKKMSFDFIIWHLELFHHVWTLKIIKGYIFSIT